MIKQLFLLVFIVFCMQSLSATESEHIQDRNVKFYVGINPLALVSFLPDNLGNAVNLYGVISGQEFGVSLYGGIYFKKEHSLELRFSTGPASAIIWDTQIQFGYIWYPLKQFIDWKEGLSTGFMLRQFFWNNRITDYVIFNLTPEILLGWRFKIKSIAIDLRGGWNFASVTWSNMPRTNTGAIWTNFPYNLTFMVGVSWIFY